MGATNQNPEDKRFVARALEATIHVGVDVPMLVIFIGAIGGFVTPGIIGLFVGAIILALGYKMFLLWLDQSPLPDQESGQSD